MNIKLFAEKPKMNEDKEKQIQFIHNIYSVLSRDLSISAEMKQKILIGSLIYTNLSAKDVQEEIANRYTHNSV